MNKYIDLGNGKTEVTVYNVKHTGSFIIDTNDVEKINFVNWHLKFCEDTNSYYVASKMDGKTVRLHRFLVLNEDEIQDSTILVDHINRDTLNNSRENLRKATKSVNNLNFKKRTTNKSGRTGVYIKSKQKILKPDGTYRFKSAKWVAQVQVNGEKKSKSFSIDKYGYDKAYEMAVAWREQWEDENDILTEK